MNIPIELIREFAKTVTETEDQKSPYLYGQIVMDNDEKCVVIDGSDVKTPILEVTDAIEGDRVMISIHDHGAVVMGNITAPASARTATNFMRFTEDGLQIGKYEGDEIVGTSTVMKDDGYYIYDEDGTPVAWFKKDAIRLGESNQAKIELLGEANYINGVTRTGTKPDGTSYTSSGVSMTGVNYASLEQSGFHENHPAEAHIAVSANKPGNGIGIDVATQCSDIAINSDFQMFPGNIVLQVHDTNKTKPSSRLSLSGGNIALEAGGLDAMVTGPVTLTGTSLKYNQKRILTEDDLIDYDNGQILGPGLGEFYETGSVDSNTSSRTNIGHVTLPKNHNYLILFTVRWPGDSSNAQGARCAYVSTSQTGSGYGMLGTSELPGGNSGGAPCTNSISCPITKSSSNRTFYLNVRQSSGVVRNYSAEVMVVRLS